jgi:hypothetical protein
MASAPPGEDVAGIVELDANGTVMLLDRPDEPGGVRLVATAGGVGCGIWLDRGRARDLALLLLEQAHETPHSVPSRWGLSPDGG